MISLPLPIKMPWLVKKLYPLYLWDRSKKSAGKKVLYITFDDGPIPEITPWVLQTLADYNARASFFMIGDNVRKHPDIFEKVINAGHTIGNHTFNHLNATKTDTDTYISNINQAQQEIKQALKTIEGTEQATIKAPDFFRPPYGRLKSKQARYINKDFKIVLYDVLAYDWKEKIHPSRCAKNVIDNAETGSIILMHDSIKASKNLKICLPAILSHFTGLGYTFKAL